MKKKLALAISCILFMVLFMPLSVRADMGPKPSVVISFQGLEGENYYVTLLSKSESTGPYSALNEEYDYSARYEEGDEDYSIYEKFLQYKDKDGYYFLQFFQNCSETQEFKWTYYPPEDFKILLYFPDRDSFVASEESYQRYAFDSYYKVDATDTAIGSVTEARTIIAEKNYDYTWELISLALRIILTIAIEIIIALLFGYRERRQLTFILIANVLTQTVLNVLLNVINYQGGQMAFVIFYILLELIVFIIEAVLYSKRLNKISIKAYSKGRGILYALVANAASFVIGLAIAQWMPGIF